MPKSEFRSERFEKPRPRLSRTLKRRPRFRLFDPSDLAVLTVAWKRGAPIGDADMTKEEFRERALKTIGAADAAYLLEAQSAKGTVPVGLVLSKLMKHRMEPAFYWFPWASPRQKVETTVHFINEMRRSQLIIVAAAKKDWPFLERVCRHGIMKRIGKSEDFMDWDVDGMIFQSLRPGLT